MIVYIAAAAQVGGTISQALSVDSTPGDDTLQRLRCRTAVTVSQTWELRNGRLRSTTTTAGQITKHERVWLRVRSDSTLGKYMCICMCTCIHICTYTPVSVPLLDTCLTHWLFIRSIRITSNYQALYGYMCTLTLLHFAASGFCTKHK